MEPTARDTGVSPSSFIEFDFVIVGGGLCGLVLAARLSEDPNVSVGVLETGRWKPDDPKLTIPARMLETFGNPEYQCVTSTVPQNYVGGRQLMCPRGRVLGGGSSVNFMVWHRASRRDLDGFELLGNFGWNFDTLAKAGRKSETFHPPDTEEQRAVAATDASFHGTDGPVQTSFSGWIPQSQKAFLDVLDKFGLVKNDQWHNGVPGGIRTSLSSVDPRTGMRSSSASAYYAPNASRSNLFVLCGATANKIEFQEEGGLQAAVGVEYVFDGKVHLVKSRKEVIISAGALDSPQLLERSGVGNPSVLTPLGLEVKINNPNVGENLQDHIITWMNYLTKPEYVTQDVLDNPDYVHEAMEAFAAPSKTQNRGLLGGTISSLIYVPVQACIPESELVEMKRKLHMDTLPTADEVIRYQLDHLEDPQRAAIEWAYVPRKLPSPNPPEPGRSYISLMVGLNHPFSRGSTHITSVDASTSPAIDPHYFENSWDKEVLVHALEKLDKAAKTEPLASFLDRRVDPAPEDDSRGFFEKYLVDSVIPGVHWVGTLSMLPREKGGVVDPKCKVYGTSNLRIVDMSIIPMQISAHPQATLYSIAELAAELIIKDHKPT